MSENMCDMPGDNKQIVQTFCAYMAGRSFSEHTIKRRTSSLSSFSKFIAPMRLADVEGAHVEEWTATLGAARTRHAYRSDLSAFYTWAAKRKLVSRNPVDDTDPIRVPKGLPRPIPADAMIHIIDTATGHLRLGLAFAAFAGLRRAEITRITTDDIQLHPFPILVVRGGKGGKDRQVPLHPELVKMLREKRPQGLLVPLSPDVLGRRARDHMHALGYPFTIHSARHAFGTELARVLKGNVVAVAKAMGHDNIQTSMNYIGWSGGEWSSLFGEMYGTHPPAA